MFPFSSIVPWLSLSQEWDVSGSEAVGRAVSTHGVLIVPECVCLPGCLLLPGSLAVNQALLLWEASDCKRAHRDASCTDTCAHTKTHVGVQAAAQRPRPALAGPSAYALLITSPFIPNATRPRFQSRRITELRWLATATEQASSLSSCAIIFV